MNGWRVADVLLEYNEYDHDGSTLIDPANRDYRNFHYMLDVADQAVRDSKTIHKMINRPGRWYLMSGMRFVHEDDLHESREQAAQAEYNRLIKEKN